MNQTTVVNLRCEYMDCPMGIDMPKPRLSWELYSNRRGVYQTGWQIKVALSTEDLLKDITLWDSGKQISDKTVGIIYGGPALESRTRYYWQVIIWDNKNNQVISEPSWWEMGLLKKIDWIARWIEPEQLPVIFDPLPEGENLFGSRKANQDYNLLHPCQMVRRPFNIEKSVKSARLYVTAHGIYRSFINGKRISSAEFSPDFTAYEKYLQYQTYDVTGNLSWGENVLGVVIADGWWAGRVNQKGESCQYGDRLGLLLQLEIEHTDDEKDIIASDDSFTSSTGPLVFSDICIGERYDARLEKSGWNKPGYDPADWIPVKIVDYNLDNLVAQYGPPVRAIKELPAVSVITTPKGETVVDIGQVITGRARIQVQGPAGTVIEIEHSEVLDEEGNFINNINARNREQRDFYVCKGKGTEVYEPWFTNHGFRYVLVEGWPGKPKPQDFTAVVLSSDMSALGTFECSDKCINRLQENIMWSTLANTLSIPTDCPQRERQGWTGDIQIFAPTACYLRDMNAFLTRWMRNVRAEQKADGQVPNIVPLLKRMGNPVKVGDNSMGDGTAGWGDAVYIVPWALYQAYGDKRILEENYDAIKVWVSFQERTAREQQPEGYENFDEAKKERNKYLWNTGFHFGDWAIPSVTMEAEEEVSGLLKSAMLTKDVVAPCFFAYSTMRMAEIAAILDKNDDVDYYTNLNRKIRKAFGEEYFDEDGRVSAHFQGIYVLALQLGLVPDHLKEKAFRQLVTLIEQNNWKLDTGFVSVPFIMDVLTMNGCRDIAYKLLYQNQCPSWLYEVEQGATTIWETWNAIQPDGQVTNVSYNHYAFGCIGDWIYREVAGLNMDTPGYKHILIKPGLDSGLSWASASLQTIYGLAKVAWIIKNSIASIEVHIPANTSATVILHNKTNQVKESNKPLEDLESIIAVRQNGNITEVDVGSGTYNFTFPL